MSIWARRAVSIPLWTALAILLAATLPIWAPLTLLVDLLTGRRKLPRTRALLFFLLYLWCEVAGIVAAGVLWFIRAGGRIGGASSYVDANAALQRVWSQTLFDGACRIFGMKLEVQGGENALPAPFLLFVRHSSTADTVLAAAAITNRNRILLKYVLKRELLWDPCLDIVGRRLPNAFIDRTGGAEAQTIAVAGLANGLDQRTAVLIYPEGTRFTPRKRDAAIEKLRKSGRPDLADLAAEFQNVLPPRLGGALSLIEAAPGVDVVFLEHSGFEGARNFQSFWSGALIDRRLSVRIRRIPAKEIPEQGRDRWLFEQWGEVDRFVTLQRAA